MDKRISKRKQIQKLDSALQLIWWEVFHLTCVGANRKEMEAALGRIQKLTYERYR